MFTLTFFQLMSRINKYNGHEHKKDSKQNIGYYFPYVDRNMSKSPALC